MEKLFHARCLLRQHEPELRLAILRRSDQSFYFVARNCKHCQCEEFVVVTSIRIYTAPSLVSMAARVDFTVEEVVDELRSKGWAVFTPDGVVVPQEVEA